MWKTKKQKKPTVKVVKPNEYIALRRIDNLKLIKIEIMIINNKNIMYRL